MATNIRIMLSAYKASHPGAIDIYDLFNRVAEPFTANDQPYTGPASFFEAIREGQTVYALCSFKEKNGTVDHRDLELLNICEDAVWREAPDHHIYHFENGYFSK